LTPLNVIINFLFEIYTKFSSIWYIELCVWTDERERERSLSDAKRSWQRTHNRWGEFIIIYGFDTIIMENTCTWGHVTQFGTPLRLRLITMGGVSCACQGYLDTCCLVFLSESVVWTHVGYFLTNGTTLHLRKFDTNNLGNK